MGSRRLYEEVARVGRRKVGGGGGIFSLSGFEVCWGAAAAVAAIAAALDNEGLLLSMELGEERSLGREDPLPDSGVVE